MANTIKFVIDGSSAGFEKAMSRIAESSRKAGDTVKDFVKGIAKVGGAYLALSGLSEMAKQFTEVSMQYEKMRATLSASVGAENMPSIFKGLQQFAKDTPYDLGQVSEAYTRMMNLGIKPTTDALKAYGNIVAATPNKKLTDFVEAVADAVTGENERLKEFGIVGKKVGKDGQKIAYTFQGITKEVKNNKDAINEYLISVAKQIAGGVAMENQSKTLAGSLSALGDSFKQFQDNFMNSSGASSGLASIVNQVSDAVNNLNDMMDSGELAGYWTSFVDYIAPVTTLVNDLIGYFQNLDSQMASSTGGSFISETWNKIVTVGKELIETLMVVIQYIDELGKNDGLKSFGEAVTTYFEPLTDIVKNTWQGILDAGTFLQQFLEFLGIGQGQVESFATGVVNAIKGLPATVALILKNVLAAVKMFVKMLASSLEAVGGIVMSAANGSISVDSVKSELNNYSKNMSGSIDQFGKDMNTNAKDFSTALGKTDKALADANKKSQDAWNKAQATRANQKATKEVNDLITGLVVTGNKKNIAEERKNTYTNLDSATDKAYKKIFGNATKASAPAASAKKGSKSGASEANKEFKDMLDYQQKLVDEQYRSGLISAKKYYDQTLSLKLQEIKATDNATKQQYQKNLDIINSTSSTEAQKKKAMEDNTNLQSKMNNMSSKELAIRQEISLRLKDAKEEYQKNINSVQKELNQIQLGGQTTSDVINDLNDRYSKLLSRAKQEDAESGANNAGKIQSLIDLSTAQAKINDLEREYTLAEAQNKATIAKNNQDVSNGSATILDARNKEIIAAQKLKDIRAETAQQELDIALATPGYSKMEIARLTELAAAAQSAQKQVNDSTKTLLTGAMDGMSSELSKLMSGTESLGDAFKNLGKTILSTFNDIVAKNLSKTLFDSLFGSASTGTEGGSTSGSGLLGSIGGMITNGLASFFGGAHAYGGTIPRGKFGLVGDQMGGGELVFSGSSPMTVLNNKKTQSVMGGGNVNLVMNVNAKDANSFNYSRNQILTKSERQVRRQYNRNT